MKNFCVLAIICVTLLTPAIASESIASATGTTYVGITLSNCSVSQVNTEWSTVAIARDQFVTAGDSHTKHYSDPMPETHDSQISLESNPLSLNPISAISHLSGYSEGTILTIGAYSIANATMNNRNGPESIEAISNTNYGVQFKRSNTGSVTVTVDYSYALDLLNAWDGISANFPPNAAGDLVLQVGLFNSAGQSLLSAKDGWILQGDILQRLYHVDAGGSVSLGPTTTTWQVNNLGTTDTYTLTVGANMFNSTYAPEPATICLLGIGALGLLKKSRA